MRKIKIFGKQISTVLLALLLTGGLASAGLLSYYGMLVGTAKVEQSVKLDDKPYTEVITYNIGESPIVAGSSDVEGPHYLTNGADVPATVQLVTSCYGTVTDCTGITTKYINKLHLENKDPTAWTVIAGDGIEADLTYEIVGETFNYELIATGLTPGKEYKLIYYGDEEKRFVNWDGDNPGKLLGTFTADGVGKITYSYSLDIGMNLPSGNDWNINPNPDYCNKNNGFDSYIHCKGAKIWLVPSTDYDGAKLTAWNPTTYLFETDLIYYFDSATNTITVPAKGRVDFYIKNSFAINLIPDTYTITTEIKPV